MRSALHWFLAVLLVVGGVTNVAAFAGAATADAPCPMMASDEGGHAPCGDPASCAQDCVVFGAVMLPAARPASTLFDVCADRMAITGSGPYRSHAAPPGLQPPR